jgi:murein hydrolase activator
MLYSAPLKVVSRSIAALAVALAAGGIVALAQPVDRDRAADLSRRAGERIAALRAEAERLAAEQQSLLGQLRRLEVERQVRTLELARPREEAQRVAVDVAALDEQVQTLEAQERAALPDVTARLVTLYKLGRGQYARLLLSASDGRQFAQAVRLASAVAEQDRQRLAQFRQRLEQLTAARGVAQERQARLRELQTAAEAARNAADRSVDAHLALVRDIDGRRDLAQRFASELLSSQQRLQAVLAGFASPAALALPIRPFKGDLDWPVPGTVRRRFGATDDGRPPSRGLEIGAPEGSAVHAIHDGQVAFADNFTGFGRLVIVDHGSQTFTLYGNLGEFEVRQGAKVTRGEPVGTVGLGADGTAGVYFELRIDGQPVDPLQWLGKR